MTDRTIDSIKKDVKHICKMYNIRPTKSKGQNFLLNTAIIKQMVTTATINSNDTVLEVGPGLGVLTEELIKQAGHVFSVELDATLLDFLKLKFSGAKNFELVQGDILKINFEELIGEVDYKVVANLPYNITSYFLRLMLNTSHRPKSMTLLLQKEVAERITAKSGDMSVLAVSVQLYGEPEIIKTVSRDDFWPSPEVDSAIIHIDNIATFDMVEKKLGGVSEKKFWQYVKIGFSSRRKQLKNNLASGLRLPVVEMENTLKEANFDPKIRAQDLSVSDWILLAQKLDKVINKTT